MTRGADASDADPSPDGAWAVAVRSRNGASQLVRVDLATGQTRELPARLPVAEAWPVWSHPRVSPDGRRIAALVHAGGAWRLVTLPAEGGDGRRAQHARCARVGARPGAPTATGSTSRATRSGIWNIVSVDAAGASGEQLLTRVTGGAFAPAPTPDGTALFFLDFAGRGVAVRRLALGGPGLSELERPTDAYPLLPPRSVEAAAFGAAPVPEARPYSVWPSQAVRPLIDFSFGPSGNTVQLGADSADVLGRLHMLAMGSIGNAVGPRGGSIAAAWRGLPAALVLQLFSAIEKPGNQGLAPRPEFDQQRWGGLPRRRVGAAVHLGPRRGARRGRGHRRRGLRDREDLRPHAGLGRRVGRVAADARRRGVRLRRRTRTARSA